MNTMNKFLVFTLVVFSLASCGKEDTSAPEWNFNSFTPMPMQGNICGQPEPEVFYVMGGDTLEFVATFTDNEALSQYKIDIHENFDCHGHGKTSDWNVLEVINLTGTTQQITKRIPVPENITAGTYHFSIQLLDAAGNQAENTFLRDVVVENPTDNVAPIVTVTQPMSAQGNTAARGGTINFQGEVNDNLPLGLGGNGKLIIDYVNQTNLNKFIAKEIEFAESQGDNFTFNETITIPNSIPTGNYKFRVYAYDGVNNLSDVVEFAFQIQ